MCQKKAEGGRRCPIHQDYNAALIKVESQRTELPQFFTEQLFVELRREGHTSSPFTAEQLNKHREALLKTVQPLKENLREAVRDLIFPDEHEDIATNYAQLTLHERATGRQKAMQKKFGTIAKQTGLTAEQVEARFMSYRKHASATASAVDTQQRDFYSTLNLPNDKRSIYAWEQFSALDAENTETERRVTHVPANPAHHDHIAFYGYDEGRLEFTLKSNPEQTLAYRNITADVWQNVESGQITDIELLQRVRGNIFYQYPDEVTAEQDAYRKRCYACGQFRATYHTCPTNLNSATPAHPVVAAAHLPAVTTMQQLPLVNPASFYPAPPPPPSPQNVTVEQQTNPTVEDLSKSSAAVLLGVKSIYDSAQIYTLDELSSEHLSLLSSEQEQLMRKYPTAKAAFYSAAGYEEPDVLVAVYDSAQALIAERFLDVFNEELYLRTFIKDADNFYSDDDQEAYENEMQNFTNKLLESGEVRSLEASDDLNDSYIFDPVVGDRPYVSIPTVSDLKEAFAANKAVMTQVSISLEPFWEDKVDSYGHLLPKDPHVQDVETMYEVFGTVVVRRNANGVMENILSERSLQCQCHQYAEKYYCPHIAYAHRHVGNVFQQAAGKAGLHAENTPLHEQIPALKRRSDVIVEENLEGYPQITFMKKNEDVYFNAISNIRAYSTPEHLRHLTADNISDQQVIEIQDYEAAGQYFDYLQIPVHPADIIDSISAADTQIPVAAVMNDHVIEGNITYNRNQHLAADGFSIRESSLKCDCYEYSIKYTCSHVRFVEQQTIMALVTEDHGVPTTQSITENLNQRHRALLRWASYEHVSSDHWAANPQLREDFTLEYETEQQTILIDQEWEAARAEEEKERIKKVNAEVEEQVSAYRETLLTKWEQTEETYTQNPELFYQDYTKAASAKRNKLESIPYRTENVTDGTCDPNTPGSRRFGIELEFILPQNFKNREKKAKALKAIGQDLYNAGLTPEREQQQYHAAQKNNWNSWSFEYDVTVDGEIVSPIMSDTPEHWEQLKKVCEILEKHGATVNSKTGSHIHISTDSYGESTAKHAELLRTVKQNEDLMYRLASNPSAHSHRGTHYCAPNIAVNKEDIPEDVQHSHHVLGFHMDHFTGLNLESSGNTEHKGSHAEFRMWDGTLNASIIQQQIMLSAALTDAAEREVLKNGQSVKPKTPAETLGTNRAKEEKLLAKANRAQKHTQESFTENYRTSAAFLDHIFRRREDKASVTALLANTKWQKQD